MSLCPVRGARARNTAGHATLSESVVGRAADAEASGANNSSDMKMLAFSLLMCSLLLVGMCRSIRLKQCLTSTRELTLFYTAQPAPASNAPLTACL